MFKKKKSDLKQSKTKGSFKKFLASDNFKVASFTISVIWYVVLIVAGAINLICNWQSISSTNLFETLTGNTIIFFLWLFLLIAPFIKGFEMFDIKVNVENPINKVSEIAVNNALSDIENGSFDQMIADTKKELNKVQEERGGE